MLTVKVSPDEDPMSLKYVLHLTAPERQPELSRAAAGARARPCGKSSAPASGSSATAGPEGAGWTDEEIAAALDVLTGSVGRWRYPAVAKDPEAVRELRAKVPRSSKLDGAGEAQLL